MFGASSAGHASIETMKKHLKTFLGLALLVATFGAFAYYLNGHRELLTQLRHIHPGILVLLLALYAVWFGALAWVMQISLRMYRKKMGLQENFLLSAYSNLANFFGPGQSGPGVRAIYLKKKHNLRVKDYIFATLLYYAFYSILSAFMLMAGSRAWWQTAVVVLAAAGGSAVVLKWYARKSQIKDGDGLNPVTLIWLFTATALQMLAQIGIYWVEVHAVAPQASFSQALTYTGAANFALFVALTPGAIGIRESFLLFSQHLHHLGSNIIVSANVIDRAVYLVFLGLLFVLVLSLHASRKFKFAQNMKADDIEDASDADELPVSDKS